MIPLALILAFCVFHVQTQSEMDRNLLNNPNFRSFYRQLTKRANNQPTCAEDPFQCTSVDSEWPEEKIKEFLKYSRMTNVSESELTSKLSKYLERRNQKQPDKLKLSSSSILAQGTKHLRHHFKNIANEIKQVILKLHVTIPEIPDVKEMKVLLKNGSSTIKQKTYKTANLVKRTLINWWLDFDVTHLINRAHENKWTVQMQFDDQPPIEPEIKHASVHVIHYNSRVKRQDEEEEEYKYRTSCTPGHKRCCRKNFIFKTHFYETLNSVISPTEFEFGLCEGSCPEYYAVLNKHALFETFVRREQDPNIKGLCCVPSKLAPLEFIHVDYDDDTKIRSSVWENAIALECGCG